MLAILLSLALALGGAATFADPPDQTGGGGASQTNADPPDNTGGGGVADPPDNTGGGN